MKQRSGKRKRWSRKTQVINLPRFWSERNKCFKNKLWKAWKKCWDYGLSMNHLWTIVMYVPPTYYLAWYVIRKPCLLKERSHCDFFFLNTRFQSDFIYWYLLCSNYLVWRWMPVGPIVRMTAWKGKYVGCNNNVVHV